MDYHEKQIRQAMGEKRHLPYVSFFDHAVEDKELTEKSGRPRFRSRVYIQKIPSAPDLVQRDIFTRAMTEEDKQDWPEEWARYLEKKEAIDNLTPPITAIPGMGVAEKAELLALGIKNCREFVDYPKGLDELEPLRETAKKIMEVSRYVKDIREGRQGVRNAPDRQMHNPAGVYRIRPETEKEKDGEEESFSYTFQVRV